MRAMIRATGMSQEIDRKSGESYLKENSRKSE